MRQLYRLRPYCCRIHAQGENNDSYMITLDISCSFDLVSRIRSEYHTPDLGDAWERLKWPWPGPTHDDAFRPGMRRCVTLPTLWAFSKTLLPIPTPDRPTTLKAIVHRWCFIPSVPQGCGCFLEGIYDVL